MLHVDTLSPTPNAAPSGAVIKNSAGKKGATSAQTRLIDISYRAVELDGQNLWREPEDVAVGQLAEAVRLADLRGKPELKINNITPWIAVGHIDSCQVPILQKKIERKLAKACEQVKRPMPECRLDLSRGEYGIRVYLGRVRPTDHVYDEDLISDSR